MAKNLLIVESPAKSRTLKRFLGKGFDVQATVGHIIDLPKSKLGVDTEDGGASLYDISLLINRYFTGCGVDYDAISHC